MKKNYLKSTPKKLWAYNFKLTFQPGGTTVTGGPNDIASEKGGITTGGGPNGTGI